MCPTVLNEGLGAKGRGTDSKIEALIIRIGFGAHDTIVIIRNHQKSRGHYHGP